MVDMTAESFLDPTRWSLPLLASKRKTATTPLFDHYKQCNTQQLHSKVVESEAVQTVIKTLSAADSNPDKEDELRTRAAKIMLRMGQDMSDRTLHMLSVVIRKIFLTLFSDLKVNIQQMDKMREEMRYSPVIFVPTHRSYMDFLLLSFVLHAHGLPVPAIAAGEDFLGMAGIAHILRWSGAFFIRRSFFDDDLYRSIFTEYVQQMVSNGTPLEYFVEGTRSRSGKALAPKFGMLATSSEPFFDNRVSDIQFVPVSISYERQLERELYPVELLGTPKPKESLSGLIKARSVLSRDYGTVHVVFGQSISLLKHSRGSVSRLKAGNVERGEKNTMVEKSKRQAIKTLGNSIISAHRSLVVVTLTVITATVVPRMANEFAIEEIYKRVQEVHDIVVERGGTVDLCGRSFREALKKSLSMLTPHVIEISNRFRRSEEAESVIVFANYRNQLSHLFIEDAMVMVCGIGRFDEGTSSVYESYVFLQKLMSDEFVLNNPPQTIDEVSHRLTEILKHLEQDETLLATSDQYLEMLPWFIWPILDCYKIVAECLLRREQLICFYSDQLEITIEETSQDMAVKQFLKLCSVHASRSCEDYKCCSSEARSLDSMKIALSWIRRFGPAGVVTSKNGVSRFLSQLQRDGIATLLESINSLSCPFGLERPDILTKCRL